MRLQWKTGPSVLELKSENSPVDIPLKVFRSLHVCSGEADRSFGTVARFVDWNSRRLVYQSSEWFCGIYYCVFLVLGLPKQCQWFQTREFVSFWEQIVTSFIFRRIFRTVYWALSYITQLHFINKKLTRLIIKVLVVMEYSSDLHRRTQAHWAYISE